MGITLMERGKSGPRNQRTQKKASHWREGDKKKRILRKCNQSGIGGVTANLRTQVLENELNLKAEATPKVENERQFQNKA